jgi:DNA-directed RNA polymerase specialized sigma24 family protein
MAWTFDQLIDRLPAPGGKWIARLRFVNNGSSQTLELKFVVFPTLAMLQDERPRVLAMLNGLPPREKMAVMRARVEQLKNHIRSNNLSVPEGDDE